MIDFKPHSETKLILRKERIQQWDKYFVVYEEEAINVLREILEAGEEKFIDLIKKQYYLNLKAIASDESVYRRIIEKYPFSKKIENELRRLKNKPLELLMFLTDIFLEIIIDPEISRLELEHLGVKFVQGFNHPELEPVRNAYYLFQPTFEKFLRSFGIYLTKLRKLPSPESIFHITSKSKKIFKERVGAFYKAIYRHFIINLYPESIKRAKKYCKELYCSSFCNLTRVSFLIHEFIHYYSFQMKITGNAATSVDRFGFGIRTKKGVFFEDLNEAVTHIITLIILQKILKSPFFKTERNYFEWAWKFSEKITDKEYPGLGNLIKVIGPIAFYWEKKTLLQSLFRKAEIIINESSKYKQQIIKLLLIIDFMQRKLSQILEDKELIVIFGEKPREDNLLKLILATFFRAYFEGDVSKLRALISLAFPGAKLKELNSLEEFVQKYCQK